MTLYTSLSLLLYIGILIGTLYTSLSLLHTVHIGILKIMYSVQIYIIYYI